MEITDMTLAQQVTPFIFLLIDLFKNQTSL